MSLQHWILRFGAASVELRLIVGDFVKWLGNERHPWSAYRALMSGRLIALDKQPGIMPVGVGETWSVQQGEPDSHALGCPAQVAQWSTVYV